MAAALRDGKAPIAPPLRCSLADFHRPSPGVVAEPAGCREALPQFRPRRRASCRPPRPGHRHLREFRSAAISTAAPRGSCIFPAHRCLRYAAVSPNASCSKRWCRQSSTTATPPAAAHGQRRRGRPLIDGPRRTHERAKAARAASSRLSSLRHGGAATLRRARHRGTRIHHVASPSMAAPPNQPSEPHSAPRSKRCTGTTLLVDTYDVTTGGHAAAPPALSSARSASIPVSLGYWPAKRREY